MHCVELLTDALCITGEGPLWDAENQQLLTVDIPGKRVRSIRWEDGAVTDRILPQQAGFLALCDRGQVLAGCEDGVYRIDNGFAPITKAQPIRGDRFNEGKVGPDGNLYLGTFSRDFSAAFYRMDTRGELTMLFDGVGNSNGLDWDTERGLLYYNDTPLKRTDSFAFGADGTLSRRQTVCTYDQGAPDGMTIDADGNLWTALWGSGKVVCTDPRTGKVLDTIQLPVSQPSSCTFAGNDLKTLVITSAAHYLHLKDEPLAGATFAVHLGVQGLPPRRMHLDI